MRYSIRHLIFATLFVGIVLATTVALMTWLYPPPTTFAIRNDTGGPLGEVEIAFYTDNNFLESAMSTNRMKAGEFIVLQPSRIFVDAKLTYNVDGTEYEYDDQVVLKTGQQWVFLIKDKDVVESGLAGDLVNEPLTHDP